MILAQRIDAVRQDEKAQLALIHEMIERMDGGRFGKAVIWPADPRQVRDNDQLKLVIGPLDKPWMEAERDTELAAEIFIDDILNDAGSTHRQYRNTLVFLMVTPEGASNIRRAAVNLLALDDIGRTTRSQLNDRQEAEFKQKYEQARNALPAAIWGGYGVVVAPSNDKGLWSGFDYDMRLNQGDTLSGRAWRILCDEQRLLEQFDPDFMRSGGRFEILWPKDKNIVNVAQLWDYFVRYTYLPLLANRAVLERTIAWGVERGLFAYCLGDPEKSLDTILIDQNISPSQCAISPHAWLLDPKIARELIAPPEDGGDEGEDGGKDEPEEGEVGDEEDEPKPPTRGYKQLHIETELDALNWRQFFNSVIQPLVNAGAHIDITVRLDVEHGQGLDPDLVDLRVRESVMQLGKKARVKAE